MDLNEDAIKAIINEDAIKAINLGFIDEIYPSDSNAEVSFLSRFFPRNFEQMIHQKIHRLPGISGFMLTFFAGHRKMPGQS